MARIAPDFDRGILVAYRYLDAPLVPISLGKQPRNAGHFIAWC